MNIELSKIKNGEPILIFNFIDEKDFNDFFCSFKTILGEESSGEPDGVRRFRDVLEKLETRTDEKYANEYHKLSSMLFASEVPIFITYLIINHIHDNETITHMNYMFTEMSNTMDMLKEIAFPAR